MEGSGRRADGLGPASGSSTTVGGRGQLNESVDCRQSTDSSSTASTVVYSMILYSTVATLARGTYQYSSLFIQ